MRYLIVCLFVAFTLLLSRPAIAAIPEPPPYPWEYLPDGAVAFIPYVTHSGPILTPDQLPPGW